jgi:hypothetical protein
VFSWGRARKTTLSIIKTKKEEHKTRNRRKILITHNSQSSPWPDGIFFAYNSQIQLLAYAHTNLAALSCARDEWGQSEKRVIYVIFGTTKGYFELRLKKQWIYNIEI